MSDEPVDEVEREDIEAEGADEEISDEDVIYQINTFGADYTVDGLVKRFERGDIFRPEFQRNFVWTLPQASKFIESILLGLPIPSVFLYREESTQKHLIVDGLQRLTTLHAFSKGRFKESDKLFKLKSVKRRYENKSFEELEPEDQRRFEDAVIHAMVIQQLAPDDKNSSVYHIFDRLNSNGTPLQPQEIRAAIYHGAFQRMLNALNETPAWREIFGPTHRRGKDQELILRFLALRFDRENYEKPMKGFLNNFMSAHRNIDDGTRSAQMDAFISTISRSYQALGAKAFRPQRSLNVSVYDAIMVAISETPDASATAISHAHASLISDDEFLKLSRDATSDETTVEGRINLATEKLRNAVNNA